MPSLDVRSVTQLVAEPPAADGSRAARREIAVLEVAVDRSARPGGRRFGSLVHAILASVRLGADESQVRLCAAAQRRLLGATEEEAAAAAIAVSAAPRTGRSSTSRPIASSWPNESATRARSERTWRPSKRRPTSLQPECC